jgi:DNA polymerase/3'-5' exonuclease PolX
MKLELAKQIAEEYITLNMDKYHRMEVAGSIKRKKPLVNDIDIVAIPKIPTEKKILKEEFKGVQVEVYLTNEKEWEVIMLIRTGSKEHNKKLCILAKRKGLSLKAGGKGLVTDDRNEEVIANTERDILINLLGKYIEPEERLNKTAQEIK